MTKRKWKNYAEFVGDKNPERFTCAKFITVKEPEDKKDKKDKKEDKNP